MFPYDLSAKLVTAAVVLNKSVRHA